MGEAEVVVGCVHRLRQAIGPSTRVPCLRCLLAGPPYPRWAIALTVYDHPSARQARPAPKVHADPPRPARKPTTFAEQVMGLNVSLTEAMPRNRTVVTSHADALLAAAARRDSESIARTARLIRFD